MPYVSEELNGVQHLAASLFLGSQDLMAMYTLYCDDSGTHAESSVAVASCLISTVDKWDKFLGAWCEASRDEGFHVFHRADFEGNYGPFDSLIWRDTVKKERTLNRLIDIVLDTAEVGFSVSVFKEDYDEMIPLDIRDKFSLGKNHYTFAFRTIIGWIKKWRNENSIVRPMNYVFDRMSKGKGEIMAQFDVPIRYPEFGMKDFGTSEGCYSFADKAYIVPLQAADLCAWEVYRSMNTRSEPFRDSFKRLFRPPEGSQLKSKFHNRDSLAELVRLVRQHEWSFGKMEP